MIALAGTRLTRAEAATRAGVVREVEYDVELDVGEDASTFRSRTVARFAARPSASTFIDLSAVVVDRATLNGRRLEASAGHRIALDDLRADNELVVDARCAYSRSGMGLHRFTDPLDGAVYLYTQLEPFEAHRVYACFDQPDLKARITVAVRAPGDWMVVSNGVADREGERQSISGGSGWRFARTPPISTYTSAIVAGPFHHVRDRHGDLELGLYCRRSLAEHLDPDEILLLTRQGLDFYSAVFDRPYPFSKYDQLFVPEFAMGAMENVGCVTVDERYVFRSAVTDAQRLSRANVLLHELSHMWFGNLVTMRWWDDLWLNEAFATYMASRALAEATRFSEQAWTEFAHLYKSWAYEEDQRPTTHPIAADIHDTAALLTYFDGITYAKGAAVLKQLAHWVGVDAFHEGVRGYIAGHAFGTAGLPDLLRHLETASGRDLGAWSRQWLTTAGVGTLRVESAVGGDDRFTAFAVLQDMPDASPAPRDHRLAIGLYRADGDALLRGRRIELDVRGERTEVPQLVGERVPDLVLLNDDDLAYTKVRVDPRSTATLTERLSAIGSPLARTLCWGALWEMTRDAVLPTRGWVRLVTAHAPGETDVTVLASVLRQAARAVDQYSAPGRSGALTAMLAAAARAGIAAAEPGSDAQLVWARRLIASDADPSFARGLLGGEIVVDGLSVGVDLRWQIVIRLASLGVAGEALIASELTRDHSVAGHRRAWLARASRPDLVAKAAAFTAAVDGSVNGEPLSLATQRAILDGFWRPGHSALLSEYAEVRWVDALTRVWAERGADERLALTAALFPATRASTAILAAADRVLATDLLPAAGRRIVAEGRDDTLRALRAQAADARAWTKEHARS